MDFLKQPTTITGLAVLAVSAILLGIGKIDAGVFVSLLAGSGVLIAIPDHTTKLAIPILLALALSACSGDPTTDAAKAHAYVVAYQPLVDDGLCRAQALANSAGAVAQAAGDAEAIKNAQLASVAAGAGCFALHPVVVPAVAP